MDYEHVGKTVLVAETAKVRVRVRVRARASSNPSPNPNPDPDPNPNPSQEADSFAGFWVEGASDAAVCPLRDVSPLRLGLGLGLALTGCWLRLGLG